MQPTYDALPNQTTSGKKGNSTTASDHALKRKNGDQATKTPKPPTPKPDVKPTTKKK